MRSKPEGSTYVDSVWGYVMEKHDGRWVRQHRLIMERYVGRKLDPGEVVHHKNGVRTDNSLENLQLMTDFEHKSEHSSNRRWSDATRAKMAESALVVADRPGERNRRSEQAKKQWEIGNIGRRVK